LDGLRLVIPQFYVDPSTTERRSSALIPGVHYVFYKPPQSTPSSTSAKTATKDQQRRPRSIKPVKSRSKDVDEPIEGLYDRRQVKRKQELLKDRRHALEAQPRSASNAFPICYIGGMTYIFNANIQVIISLLRPAKLS